MTISGSACLSRDVSVETGERDRPGRIAARLARQIDRADAFLCSLRLRTLGSVGGTPTDAGETPALPGTWERGNGSPRIKRVRRLRVSKILATARQNHFVREPLLSLQACLS